MTSANDHYPPGRPLTRHNSWPYPFARFSHQLQVLIYYSFCLACVGVCICMRYKKPSMPLRVLVGKLNNADDTRTCCRIVIVLAWSSSGERLIHAIARYFLQDTCSTVGSCSGLFIIFTVLCALQKPSMPLRGLVGKLPSADDARACCRVVVVAAWPLLVQKINSCHSTVFFAGHV